MGARATWRGATDGGSVGASLRWPTTVSWRLSPPAVPKALAHPGERHACDWGARGEAARGDRSLLGVERSAERAAAKGLRAEGEETPDLERRDGVEDILSRGTRAHGRGETGNQEPTDEDLFLKIPNMVP